MTQMYNLCILINIFSGEKIKTEWRGLQLLTTKILRVLMDSFFLLPSSTSLFSIPKGKLIKSQKQIKSKIWKLICCSLSYYLG